jgi:hypothetical protein
VIFDESKCPTESKLANFAKYVRRQSIARFMIQYELFKKVLNVKGSIVECGVHHGGGVMAWAKLSSIFEPYNYRRKVIGFDTFDGFPDTHSSDANTPKKVCSGRATTHILNYLNALPNTMKIDF